MHPLEVDFNLEKASANDLNYKSVFLSHKFYDC